MILGGPGSSDVLAGISPPAMAAAVIYTALGLLLIFLSLLAVERLLGIPLRQEIREQRSVAAGVLAAAVVLAVCALLVAGLILGCPPGAPWLQ